MDKRIYRAYCGAISTGSVEDTIKNVGKLAQNGMAETDREIIRIMLKN